MPKAPLSKAEYEERGGLGVPTSPPKFHKGKIYVFIWNIEETLNAKKQEIKKNTLALVKLDGEQVQLSKKIERAKRSFRKERKRGDLKFEKNDSKKDSWRSKAYPYDTSTSKSCFKI